MTTNGPAPAMPKFARDIQFVFDEGVLPIVPTVQEFRGGKPYVEFPMVRFRNTFGQTKNGLPLEAVMGESGDVIAWKVSADDRVYVVYDPQEAW